MGQAADCTPAAALTSPGSLLSPGTGRGGGGELPPQDPGSFGCLQPAGGAASIPALQGAGGGRVRRRLLACESCRGSCGASGVCGVSVLSPIYLSLCHLPPRGGRRLPRCRGFLSLSIYSASRAGACAPLSACAGGARSPPEAFGAAAGSPSGMRAGPGTAPSSPVPPFSGGSGGSCGLAAAVLPPPPKPPSSVLLRGGPAGDPRLAARLWEGAQGWPGRVPFTGCPLGRSEVSWQESGARRGWPRAAPSPPRAEGRQGSGLGGLRGH